MLKHRPDVIFYYPQHFNRSVAGTNHYFQPLIDLCTQSGFNCLVLEEPAYGCGFPRDSRNMCADAFYWFVWLMHKLMINVLHMSLHRSDMYIGRLIDILTFHKFRAKCYITISNSMIDVLGEINPNGNVYDYQHGIIYYGHPGYFMNNQKLRPEFYVKNRRVLLWGQLYKKNLMQLPVVDNFDEKFIVVGYSMYHKIALIEKQKNKIILISMQFTSDISPEITKGKLEMLEEYVDEATKRNYTVVLKHHPRYAGEVDLEPLLNRCNGKVRITKSAISELVNEIKLHVTWGSTTAMEYAAYGIPTFFLRDNRLDWATALFYGKYNYPLYDNISSSEVLRRIDDSKTYQDDCITVKQWYESAYEPLNTDLLMKILNGNDE